MRKTRATDVGEHLGVVSLRNGAADIWFAWVAAHAPSVDRYAARLLSEDERRFLEGYRIRESADRYVVTRALVRSVLADRLRMEPAAIPVSRTGTGKPVVAGDIHFNISHSGELILLALSESHPVGVDVERRRQLGKVDALTDRWLSDAEKQALDAMTRRGVGASDAFLRVWSLKEARLKALGVGISGASRVRLEEIDATPLDELLDRLSAPHVPDYVGAIALA